MRSVLILQIGKAIDETANTTEIEAETGEIVTETDTGMTEIGTGLIGVGVEMETTRGVRMGEEVVMQKET